ncbi:cilia- and flagella-associated protein 157-like isoform X2 [Poeciliopsis prolifica]|uniref:cilia- and flagella-associated protein 157-like isoform X2 n=1 Tax=Poeciliopsis prolifica TaxID=188132 RepID=UPI00241390A7|nr:cilia- and flagella-associated protein 157-like isoform X2 [Poeciliopsis prolifica]
MQEKDTKPSGSSQAKDKAKASEEPPDAEDPAREKSLFLTQISFLDEQLEKFQLQCDELKEQKKDIVLKSGALQKDTNDILEYLQHYLSVLEKDEEELKAKVERQLQGDRHKTQSLEQLLSAERQELQDTLDQLSSDRDNQAARIEDQRLQLIEQERKIDMQKTLDKELTFLERHHAAEINKMYLEKREIIDEMKQNVMNSIRQRVKAMIQEETVEHQRLRADVESLSLQSLVLLWRKKAEHDRVKSLSRTSIKIRVMIHKMNQKINVLRKESVKLRRRCKLLSGHINELQNSRESLLAYQEAYRSCLLSGSEECRQKSSAVALLLERLQKERSRRRNLEGDLKRAVSVLTAIATDSEKIPGSQPRLQNLLRLMDTREPQDADRTAGPTEPAREEEEEEEEEEALFLMAKLRPGDLYLVPGPSWTPRTAPTHRSLTPRNRVKLPPIQKSLWQTALHEWMT